MIQFNTALYPIKRYISDPRIIFCFIWFLSFFFGGSVAVFYKSSSSDYIFNVLNTKPVVFSLLTCLFPIIFPYLGFRLNHNPIFGISLLCFIKGFVFGFCINTYLLLEAYTGWLCILLSQFTGLVSLVPVLFYWITILDKQFNHIVINTIISLVVCFIIWLFDYTYISEVIKAIN